MDLEKLFALMLQYKMYYFSGNNNPNLKEFDFSTGYNGSGSSVNIEIHNIPLINNIDLLICHNDKRYEYKSIDVEYTFERIQKDLS